VVGLAIRFELGRYHANPWGAHVNDAANEWPPSEWRLLRALYSTARTNVRHTIRQPALDRALQTLIDAPPPVFVLPATAAAHTRHYMPLPSYSALRAGDTAKVLDGFLAIDPDAELKVWWDAALDADAADAFAEVARSLGYLGRSESVCSAQMIAGAGPDPGTASAAPAESMPTLGDAHELVDLLCLQRGQPLETLTVSVTDLRKRRRLIPPGTQSVSYALAPAKPQRTRRLSSALDTPPTLALFRLRGSARPAITEAVAVGQALRGALQHVYGKHNAKAASPTFSGRQGDGPREDQHRHAHYLALSDAHSRQVDRLAVWAPEGFGAAEVAALAGVTHLSLHTVSERLPIALAALADATDLRLQELVGSARSWRSATPFGLVRYPKVRRGESLDAPADQVRRELARRGLPEPVDVTLEQGSWHRFRSSRSGQSRLERARLVGVRLQFDEPVHGPLALGALCHYGLGLFEPCE
jgi:CRISPR-associated protein Csb2